MDKESIDTLVSKVFRLRKLVKREPKPPRPRRLDEGPALEALKRFRRLHGQR